jgi:hypothetical protein
VLGIAGSGVEVHIQIKGRKRPDRLFFKKHHMIAGTLLEMGPEIGFSRGKEVVVSRQDCHGMTLKLLQNLGCPDNIFFRDANLVKQVSGNNEKIALGLIGRINKTLQRLESCFDQPVLDGFGIALEFYAQMIVRGMKYFERHNSSLLRTHQL